MFQFSLKMACWVRLILWSREAHSTEWMQCLINRWNTLMPVSVSSCSWQGKVRSFRDPLQRFVSRKTLSQMWSWKVIGIEAMSDPPCLLGWILRLAVWGEVVRSRWLHCHVFHHQCRNPCLLFLGCEALWENSNSTKHHTFHDAKQNEDHRKNKLFKIFLSNSSHLLCNQVFFVWNFAKLWHRCKFTIARFFHSFK